MKVTQQPLSLETLDTLAEVDTLLVFVGEDERPLQGVSGFLDWRMCGGFSRLLSTGFFSGAAGDSLLIPTAGRVAAGRVVALGVGKRTELTSSGVVEALGRAVQVLEKAGVSGVALEVPGGPLLDEGSRIAALEQVFLARFTGQRVVVLADRQQSAGPPGAPEKRGR